MVLILLPFLCNHDNLILKLHQKKQKQKQKKKNKKNSYLDEGWLFIGSFNLGSVPGMINKEVLVRFIYKPAKSTVKFFI